MQQLDNQTVQLIFVGLVALAMVTQAIVLIAVLAALRKATRSLGEQIEEFKSSVVPVVDKTREVLTRIAPKIEETTEDLAVLTRALRQQTADVQTAADDIVSRARRQAGRIDSMLTNILDALERAGVFMADTVSKPMRQLSALMASAKAVVEALRNNQPVPHTPSHRAASPLTPSDHSSNDNDMFA